MDAIRTNEIEKQYQDIERKNGNLGQKLTKPMEALKFGYHENAVVLCGSILQSILKDIWRRDNVPGDPETQNVQKLLDGAKGSIDDQLIRRYFYEATEVSLKVDAGEHLKMEDAFEMLRKLCSVVMWYLTKYSYENLKRRVIPARRVLVLISLVFVFSVVSSSFVTHSFFSRSSGSRPTAPLAIGKTLLPQTTAPVNTQVSEQNKGKNELTHVEWANKAVKQADNGDWDGVVSSYTQALSLHLYYRYYACRAAGYVNKGLYQRALSDCNESLIMHPNYGYAYYIRGKAYEGLNEIDKARKDLMKGCSLRYSDACKSYEKLTGKKISVADKENSKNR